MSHRQSQLRLQANSTSDMRKAVSFLCSQNVFLIAKFPCIFGNHFIAMVFFRLAFLGIHLVPTLAANPPDSPVTFATPQVSTNFSDLLEALPSLTNSTSSSTPLVNRSIQWQCGWTWGGGNYASSCFDAMRHMTFVPGPATQQFTWGPRNQARYDVPLPQRVASCKSSQSVASSFD